MNPTDYAYLSEFLLESLVLWEPTRNTCWRDVSFPWHKAGAWRESRRWFRSSNGDWTTNGFLRQ